jgi:hypothetical protein
LSILISLISIFENIQIISPAGAATLTARPNIFKVFS